MFSTEDHVLIKVHQEKRYDNSHFSYFSLSLDYFILVLMLFAIVMLGLVSSLLRQEIGWEECLWNDLFYVEWVVKP